MPEATPQLTGKAQTGVPDLAAQWPKLCFACDTSSSYHFCTFLMEGTQQATHTSSVKRTICIATSKVNRLWCINGQCEIIKDLMNITKDLIDECSPRYPDCHYAIQIIIPGMLGPANVYQTRLLCLSCWHEPKIYSFCTRSMYSAPLLLIKLPIELDQGVLVLKSMAWP